MSERRSLAGIRLALVAAFALVAVGLVAAAFLLLRSMRLGAREGAAAELEAVSALKVAVIVKWREEGVRAAAFPAGYPSVIRLADQDSRGKVEKGLLAHAQEILAHVGTENGYLRVSLSAPDGRVLAGWGLPGVPQDPFDPALYREAIEKGSATAIRAEPGRERPVLHAAVSLREHGAPERVLALCTDMGRLFDEVIHSWPVPSRTGATSLVRPDGNEVLVFTGRGILPGGEVATRLPLGADQYPAVQAVRGARGVVEGVSVRGHPVLAAIRPIPGTRWQLLSHKDLDEIDEPIRRPFAVIAGLLATLLGACALVVALWWRRDTAQVRMEATLRESRGLFQLALAGTHHVWDLDLAKGRLTLDPGGATELGSGAEVLEGELGAMLSRFVHPEDVARFQAGLEAHARGDTPILEVEHRTLEGQGRGDARWILWRGRASQRGADGRAGRITGVLSDVTALQEMKAQLERSERLASLGTLAAGVAHEINNPLSYVLANLQYLAPTLEAAGAPTDQRDALKEAVDGAERVRDVVRGLRTFSRPGTGPRVPADVRAEVEAALRLAQNEIRHRARLEVDVRAMPRVLAGAHELGQIFVNLLVNAAQSIPEGHASANLIRVTAGTDPSGWARVEVRDTGAGMTPEVLRRVFDPFFTTKGRSAGTGLGLAIVHSVVAGAGGRIEVASNVGQGSVFRVLLPPAPPEAELQPAPTPDPPARPRRVLLVDDDPLVARAIARTLGADHHMTVVSAPEALARVEGGEQFDAVLCDVMMPQMTGAELHQRIAARDPAAARRMIFITGGAFTESAAEFIRQVGNPCLEKPFDPTQLREALAAVARRAT